MRTLLAWYCNIIQHIFDLARPGKPWLSSHETLLLVLVLSTQETLLMLLNEPASSNILSFQYRYKRKDKHQGSQIKQQIVRCRTPYAACCLYIYPLLSSVPSFFIGHQFPSYLKVVNPCAWHGMEAYDYEFINVATNMDSQQCKLAALNSA